MNQPFPANNQHNVFSEPGKLAASLISESRRLHPAFGFCGDNALSYVPDHLLNYVVSILKNNPVAPPHVSSEQWSQLLSILYPHHILPLLYWNICAFPPEFSPPKEIIGQLRQAFMSSRVQVINMERQLAEILEAFKKEGIRILVLKGPALGRMVYPNSALRTGSDIDLLALPENMNISRTILEKLGYRCIEKRFDVSRDFYDDEIFTHQQNPQYRRQVELHWDIHRFSGIKQKGGMEDFFHRAVTIGDADLKFEALHPIDALIHRAVNNAFDHDTDIRFCWIYDIALLARNLSIPEDWKVLQERSVDWCACFAVRHSLTLAQIWTGLRIPDEYENFFDGHLPSRIEADAWHHIIHRHHRLLSSFRLHFSPSAGFHEKIRFFFHLLFPAPAYMKKGYLSSDCGQNRWQLLLAYVRRWWKWIRRLIL